MFSKKLPTTNEDKIVALQTALDQEELNGFGIISEKDIQDLHTFLISFEGMRFVYNQALEDEKKAKIQYDEFFKNIQLYISHFIQILQFTVIRNEIKIENLALYGFEDGNELVLPNLSTEEAILKWGKNLMEGETERIYRGGIPLYNPAIAKVKVHYELFTEIVQSLKIYKKNVSRLRESLREMQRKADNWLMNIRTKIEEKALNLSINEQAALFKAYKIQNPYSRGEQLNVFD
jgi:hypothetical protein